MGLFEVELCILLCILILFGLVLRTSMVWSVSSKLVVVICVHFVWNRFLVFVCEHGLSVVVGSSCLRVIVFCLIMMIEL